MDVAVCVCMSACDGRINANLAVPNYLDIPHITEVDNERHRRVIYCSLSIAL